MASDWNSLHLPALVPGVLVGILLLLWIVWDVWDKRGAIHAHLQRFPGPPVWPLVGTMYHTRGMNPAKAFDMFRHWAKLYGGTYKLLINSRVFTLNIIRCQEAEALLSGTRNTDKSLVYRFMHPFIGDGLLNSSGQKWLQRRRILTPSFHFNILNGFHRTFCEEIEKLAIRIDRKQTEVPGVAEIELQSMMSRFTLNTICETSMGVKLDTMAGAREYRAGIYKVGEMMVYRCVRPWLYLDWTYWLLGYMRKLRHLLKPLLAFTTAIIEQRRELLENGTITDRSENDDNDQRLYDGKKRHAMLDTLLAAEMRGLIDADGIREEVDTFTFEGHDTTASALVFIFLTLAWEPKIQERLYHELRELRDQKDGDHFTPIDFTALKFFDRVIKECLRLWPPVAFISRSVTDALTLPDGRTIPRGCMANVHIFDLHRDPEQFPDPDRFDPDRFLPERVAVRNPFAYVPFSAGSRNCIGQKYALLEVKTAVAYLVLRYRILPVTQRSDIRFIADLVLRASTPLVVRFERRTHGLA